MPVAVAMMTAVGVAVVGVAVVMAVIVAVDVIVAVAAQAADADGDDDRQSHHRAHDRGDVPAVVVVVCHLQQHPPRRHTYVPRRPEIERDAAGAGMRGR
jgi:Na+-transporting methylmalonyl-CoA/oxaloacetate decarboxylase gamma subunit